jgi:hypothetical protein
VPGGRELAVVIVKLKLPLAPVTVVGANAQVACEASRPDSDRLTSEMKPPTEPRVTV